MKAPMFEMSADARLLRQELAKVKIGETISYKRLGEAIGRRVVGASPALQTARRSIFKGEMMLFSCVSGQGLYRMKDDDIVANADRDIQSIRRGARRGAMRLAAVVDYAALSPQKQLAHTTKMSIMTAVASMATEKSMKTIEAEAAKSPTRRELPVAQTLAAFIADR